MRYNIWTLWDEDFPQNLHSLLDWTPGFSQVKGAQTPERSKLLAIPLILNGAYTPGTGACATTLLTRSISASLSVLEVMLVTIKAEEKMLSSLLKVRRLKATVICSCTTLWVVPDPQRKALFEPSQLVSHSSCQSRILLHWLFQGGWKELQAVLIHYKPAVCMYVEV